VTRYNGIVGPAPRALIAMLGIAGCDAVFGLHHRDPGMLDAAIDGGADATTDARPLLCGSGHDEDGDLYADSCDPCPSDFGDRTDSDGDGVGDACDPNPMTPGDSFVWFDSFASDDGMWTQTDGSWQFENDAFVAMPSSDAERTSGTAVVYDSTIEVWLDDFDGGSAGAAGAGMAFKGNGPSYCLVAQGSNGQQLVLEDGVGGIQAMTDLPGSGATRIREAYAFNASPAITCAASHPGFAISTISGFNGVASQLTGVLLHTSADASVSVTSAMLIKSP